MVFGVGVNGDYRTQRLAVIIPPPHTRALHSSQHGCCTSSLCNSHTFGTRPVRVSMLAAELERCRLCTQLERCQICAGDKQQSTSLFSLLCNEHVDEARSLMHEVLASCTTEALVALAGTDHWHREQLRPQMLKLREEHDDDCDTLACSLGCCHGSQLQHLRAITIADGLPLRLRSLLGTWLREKGRLGCVHCVRCESWWHRGDLPWIDLAPLRAGEPQAMSLEERFTIARFDTEDGLLETIFARVQP